MMTSRTSLLFTLAQISAHMAILKRVQERVLKTLSFRGNVLHPGGYLSSGELSSTHACQTLNRRSPGDSKRLKTADNTTKSREMKGLRRTHQMRTEIIAQAEHFKLPVRLKID